MTNNNPLQAVIGVQTSVPATVYHAYLVLLMYVWRALLRTTVRSSDPPHIINIQDPPEAANSLFGDIHWDFEYLPETDIQIDEDWREKSTIVGELYEAAISCATSAVDFVSGLESPAYSQFWYSC